MNTNLNSIVDLMAEDFEVSKKDAREFLKTAFQRIGTCIINLEENEKMAISGFGTFKKVLRPARTCRNPQTGGTLEVPAHYVIKFRPAPDIKNAI